MNKQKIARELIRIAKELLGNKTKVGFINGWKELTTLTPELKKEAKKKNIFRSGYGSEVKIFVKMKDDELVDWIIVTDDGHYYEQNEDYMIWTSGKYALTAPNDTALNKMLKQYMRSGRMTRQPGY